MSDTYQARGNLPLVSSLRMPQRSSSPVDRSGLAPLEDSAQDVNGASLLGTGLMNEVGEYNCFLNVIIQVGILKANFFQYLIMLTAVI